MHQKTAESENDFIKFLDQFWKIEGDTENKF